MRGIRIWCRVLNCSPQRLIGVMTENENERMRMKRLKIEDGKAAVSSTCPTPCWECFCDESYFGLWAVRETGERRWGHCFHVQTRAEGEGLRDLLNKLTGTPNARLDRTETADKED